MRITVIVGTRPEIIKMAPLVFEIKKRRLDLDFVHTGQHYDKLMSEVFFNDLMLPQPDSFLSVGSGTQAEQLAKAMTGIEGELVEYDPDIVLVQGDTNTVLAGALAGTKAGYPVGHVEAGLRSYDLRMPEEHNRRLTDHLSTLLFAPTKNSADILRKESVQGRIFVTGNTVIDACNRYAAIASSRSRILSKLDFDRYCLATAHRAENVDSHETLGNFIEIFEKSPVPVVYPAHPRTRKLLKDFGLMSRVERSGNIQLIDPAGYFDFLTLMRNSAFIMTDSGGIQEEATAPSINKKVFVLRQSTERPEAVTSGHATVVGTEPRKVLAAVRSYVKKGMKSPPKSNPYGKGDAAKRILDSIQKDSKNRR